jgi:vacuolar-type H+-ATPase subunit I/STV1
MISTTVFAQEDWTPPIGPGYDDNPPQSDKDLIEEIRQFISEGSYIWALSGCEAMFKYFPDTEYKDEIDLIKMVCELKMDKYTDKLEEVEDFLDRDLTLEIEKKALIIYLDLITDMKIPYNKYQWSSYVNEFFNNDESRIQEKRDDIRKRLAELL